VSLRQLGYHFDVELCRTIILWGICFLVCWGGGVGFDGKYWHEIHTEGVGAIVSGGITIGASSGESSYINGGSASVMCSGETLFGGSYAEAGWGYDTLDKPITFPTGGGVGASFGAGAGCAVMASYTDPG
jgi:hypothetical protein